MGISFHSNPKPEGKTKTKIRRKKIKPNWDNNPATKHTYLSNINIDYKTSFSIK